MWKINFVMRSDKTPSELLREAGYILYECKSEEDMTKFKKYYAPGEELCSFWLNRLESSFVFFAVKENVDDIKREDFKNPKRQDLYGNKCDKYSVLLKMMLTLYQLKTDIIILLMILMLLFRII